MDEEIRAQLSDLSLDPAKPLIISDADEVLLRFMERLEHFLEQQGLWIDLQSYNLNDNIRNRVTNEPVQLPNLIDDFFVSETRHIAPTPDAGDALARLSARAQILVLTNLPMHAKQARADNLAAHGMDYPLLVGSGLKGPMVAEIIGQHTPPIFFLDDIAYRIDSVAEHTPHVSRIHFVADPRLAQLASPAKNADARIDIWNEAHDWISTKLDTLGY